MSVVTFSKSGLRNVTHRFDTSGSKTILTLFWDDSEGSHQIEMQDADAIAASKVLFAKRGQIERTEYLKELIAQERY